MKDLLRRLLAATFEIAVGLTLGLLIALFVLGRR